MIDLLRVCAGTVALTSCLVIQHKPVSHLVKEKLTKQHSDPSLRSGRDSNSRDSDSVYHSL